MISSADLAGALAVTEFTGSDIYMAVLCGLEIAENCPPHIVDYFT